MEEEVVKVKVVVVVVEVEEVEEAEELAGVEVEVGVRRRW